MGSFSLMTNHTHLLLRQGEVSLDRIFHAAHTKYAKRFNERRKTNGHVFQGRPGCKIVLDETYLRTLVGYVHRNAPDAGICKNVTDYRWSSWYWFEGKKCDWIRLKCWEYPPGFDGRGRVNAFRSAIALESYECPEGPGYIGTQEQWDGIERRREGREGQKFKERRGRKSPEEIIQRVLLGTTISPQELCSPRRDRTISTLRHTAMSLMYEEGYGPTEIGKCFHRTPMIVIRSHGAWARKNTGRQ